MKKILFVALFVLFAASASSQTVQNPSTVEFIPSTDHSVTLPDGSPYVLRYELRVFLDGGVAPVSTYDLGKPAPAPDGLVRAALGPVLPSVPVGVKLVIRVVSIGSAGEGVSQPSNPFFTVFAPASPGQPAVK